MNYGYVITASADRCGAPITSLTHAANMSDLGHSRWSQWSTMTHPEQPHHNKHGRASALHSVPPQPSRGAPSYWLTGSEPIRGLLEFQQMLWSIPWLMAARRGDGHAVFVLPGLMASDGSTLVLRNYLDFLGYRVYGWHLGRNVGPTNAVVYELPAAVERIAQRSGGKVTLVGWSLGGIYARNLAQRRPSDVRQVITLGSPYRLNGPGQSRADRTFRRYSHLHATEGPIPNIELSAQQLKVPSTSVYSRWDGIVAWDRCIEPTGPISENVRVRASHLGFGVDAYTLWAIANRLAQPADQWQPFKAPLPLRAFYPTPDEG